MAKVANDLPTAVQAQVRQSCRMSTYMETTVTNQIQPFDRPLAEQQEPKYIRRSRPRITGNSEPISTLLARPFDDENKKTFFWH